MGPGQQLHCLGGGAVASDLPVMVMVQAHDLGQHVSISGVGLRARGGVPFPIPGPGHRVDRIDPIAGREQGLHPGPAIGLDPDPDLPGHLRRIQV
jgi:hypothetical protein